MKVTNIVDALSSIASIEAEADMFFKVLSEYEADPSDRNRRRVVMQMISIGFTNDDIKESWTGLDCPSEAEVVRLRKMIEDRVKA